MKNKIKKITLFNSSTSLLLLFIFFLSCNKTNESAHQIENIQYKEIKSWVDIFHTNLPNAPMPNLNKMVKVFFKNHFVVKVPLFGSSGNLYFTKMKDLEVEFIRIVPKDKIIKFPFSGSYEYMDMNNYSYKRINYNNGKLISWKSSGKLTQNENDGERYQINTSWLSQLWNCISSFLFAVPAKDASGDWGSCSVLGGSSSDSGNENLLPPDGGGGQFNWFQYFESIIPPLGTIGTEVSGVTSGASNEAGSVTDEEMTNQGMTDDIVASFVSDPNASKPRPSFSSMLGHSLPSSWTYQEVAQSIGGEVYSPLMVDKNTCATRVSHMLNESNSLIPAAPWATFTGSNGKNYIMGASTMLSYLKSAFGTDISNTIILKSTPSHILMQDEIKATLSGKKGIFVIIPVDQSKETGFGATGHVDLMNSDLTTASGHQYYFCRGGVKEVYLFILN